MTFSKVIDEIKNLLSLSFSQLNYPPIEYDVTEPPLKEFGDLTSNIAFLLGKKLKRKPSSIANEIVEKVLLPRIDTIVKTEDLLFFLYRHIVQDTSILKLIMNCSASSY